MLSWTGLVDKMALDAFIVLKKIRTFAGVYSKTFCWTVLSSKSVARDQVGTSWSLEWATVNGSCNATINHVGCKAMIWYEGGQQIDGQNVECSHSGNEGGLLFIKFYLFTSGVQRCKDYFSTWFNLCVLTRYCFLARREWTKPSGIDFLKSAFSFVIASTLMWTVIQNTTNNTYEVKAFLN